MLEHKHIIKYLAARAAGNLSIRNQAKLEAHLSECFSCQAAAKNFQRSLQELTEVLTEVTSTSLQERVIQAARNPVQSRVESGWRSVWAGAMVLAGVMLFSLVMTQPGITKEQIIQDYGDEAQAVWEGGGVDSYSTWLQESWDESTWLEQASAGQSEWN